MIVWKSLQSRCKKQKIERDFIPYKPRRGQWHEISDDAQFRDSILDETEPLLGDENIQDVATY